MIVMDNANPEGISIGPAHAMPKRLGQSFGQQGAIKRQITKRESRRQYARVEKKNR